MNNSTSIDERRFVLLLHRAGPKSDRPSHWDLMIEAGESLATWAFLTDPMALRDQLAERLAPHRRSYLEYEGPISGERGEVTRTVGGRCVVYESGETRWRVGFREPEWRCELTLRHQSAAAWSASFVGLNSDGGK